MADEYQNAIRKAAYAYYKYSDLDENVREFEKRNVPKSVKRHAPVIAALATLLIENRVSFKWTF